MEDTGSERSEPEVDLAKDTSRGEGGTPQVENMLLFQNQPKRASPMCNLCGGGVSVEWADLYQEWRCDTCYSPTVRDGFDRGDPLPSNSQPFHVGFGKEDLLCADGCNVGSSAAAYDGCVGGDCSTGFGSVMEASSSAANAEDATDIDTGGRKTIRGDFLLSNSLPFSSWLR